MYELLSFVLHKWLYVLNLPLCFQLGQFGNVEDLFLYLSLSCGWFYREIRV